MRLQRCLTLIAAFSILLSVAAPAWAGTTGTLGGTVTDKKTGAAVADVKVTIVSPSQSSTTKTDTRGHFIFVSVAPDSYTISIEREGYEPISNVVTIQADQSLQFNAVIEPSIKTIGTVTAKAATGNVRPGITSDVYTIDAAMQRRAAPLGGGGGLMSAYSAIQSVPGVYVPPNQSGFFQILHIRGGDYNQTGYELDGIPLNNTYNNYPPGPASSLGQQELQVYAGSTPANSEGSGLAGYVNQVLRTGTYPGFASAELGIGGPIFFHSARVEVGTASADRRFSFYAGFDGHIQTFRYVDQFNGASVSNTFGTPFSLCPSGASQKVYPSCFEGGAPSISGYFPSAGAPSTSAQPAIILGPINAGYYFTSLVSDHNSVVNVHYRLPPNIDRGADDFQFLYNTNYIYTQFYSSPNDVGIPNVIGLSQPIPYYSDTFSYKGPIATTVPSNVLQNIDVYNFPASPRHPFQGPIPVNNRDADGNSSSILKLQWQHDVGSNAYNRLYAYSYYYDYLDTGPMSAYLYYDPPTAADYTIIGHTYGLNETFASQINEKHFLTFQGSVTTARNYYNDNYQTYIKGGSGGDVLAALTDPGWTRNGYCYALPSSGTVATLTTCNPNVYSGTFVSLYQTGLSLLGRGFSPPGLYDYYGNSVPVNVSGYQCGNAPCQLSLTENGTYSDTNAVGSTFFALSATDRFRPTPKWNIDLGLRFDSYGYNLADTTATPARAFWFAAYNTDMCANPNIQFGNPVDKSQIYQYDPNVPGALSPTQPCPSAQGWHPLNLQNTNPAGFRYNILQPRIGATYSVDPSTVLRASWGVYSQQPGGQTQQNNTGEQNLPFDLLGKSLASYGFNTPAQEIRPEISYNADISLEKAFKNGVSLKFTPYLRYTHNQLEFFYLNPIEDDQLNVGNQTSEGFELQVNTGDFNRNGFASQLAFTYTNSYIRFGLLPNGGTVVTSLNNDIGHYNAYTSACAPGGSAYGKKQWGQPVCAPGSFGAACYVAPLTADSSTYASVAPSKCSTAGAYANPYWNAPVQPLLNPNANYPAFDVFPGALASNSVSTFTQPYVATLILNYKHDKLSVTPMFQFAAGNRYGAPETSQGIDPAAGCTPLTTPPTSDPRYNYGFPSGASLANAYDASTCPGRIPIPNPYTGNFDAPGAFRNPAQLSMQASINYQVTKRVDLNLALANIFFTCFGGQHTGFTYYWSSNVCAYQTLVGENTSSPLLPVGNVYNPADNVQKIFRYPYEPLFGANNVDGNSTVSPFAFYLTARFKI